MSAKTAEGIFSKSLWTLDYPFPEMYVVKLRQINIWKPVEWRNKKNYNSNTPFPIYKLRNSRLDDKSHTNSLEESSYIGIKNNLF